MRHAIRPRLTIRVAVAGVLLLVMAAFWLVAIAIIDHAYRRLARDAEAGLGATARLVALAHSQWVDETRGLSAALAAMLPGTGFQPDKCQPLLAATLSSTHGYAAVVVVSPDGATLCGSSEDVPGSDFRDRAYVRRALDSGTFAVGEYVVGRVSHQTVLPTAYGARDAQGAPSFALIVSKRLDWFQELAERLNLPHDVRVTLVDRRGAVLAAIPREAAAMGSIFEVSAVLDARAARGTGAVVLGDRVHAFAPLGEGALSALTVVVSRPRSALLGAIDQFRVQANVAVAVVMVAIILLLFHAMRRLVLAPLAHLLDGIHAVHSGDLAWRAERPAVDTVEMGRLYQGFDDMVAAVAKTQAEIRAQADTLEQSNRDLQHFAYMVSHDLREPLRSVSGFAQLLARRYASVVDAEGREFVGFITDGISRMSRMLDGILAYSRIETQGPPTGPMVLDRSLDLALSALHAAITEAGAVVMRPQRLPVVRGDTEQLGRLFQNLLANSIKFRRADTAPVIDVTARRDGAFWEITVADNGIGIAEEGRERIFLLFHRQARRDQYDGDGIGLAMVKRIIDRHGGTIRATMAAGGGTAMVFTLRAADEAS